ncbi:MAG: hypothetical protein AYP45_07825 [Candidatus Brocadia carolinensis]|uniref:Uncharacterized protein n=1 Tax=Candidatus Brocadia carolinensis TaxID=1004156 RepID=A0A1V4AU68_9BACT|nr:MAG: hypothetical protein AYP45_07825 [Candidatus Brocadia caroliniensis]
MTTMKPDNTPEAITPEEKAKKLGISVEQFRKLEPGLADAKLKGKFGICQWKLDTLLNNLDSKGRVDICFG